MRSGHREGSAQFHGHFRRKLLCPVPPALSGHPGRDTDHFTTDRPYFTPGTRNPEEGSQFRWGVRSGVQGGGQRALLAEAALELRLNESQSTGHEIPANGANVNTET